MKRLLGLLMISVVFGSVGCGNSVDAVPAPTPTPTATPTPTPTPGSRSGPYTLAVAAPVGVVCDAYTFYFTASSVNITVSGGDFTPNWGFAPNGSTLSLPDPEHGTITGDDFVANYTYCDYDIGSASTIKHVVTWTGTYNVDGSFDSTLTQILRAAPGNLVATCGATEMGPDVTNALTTCTSPGISSAIHGTPQ